MKTKQLLTLLTSAAFVTGSAQAAAVIWNVSTISGNETDISTAGTGIIAASGADGGTNANLVDNVTVATVNGVVFTDAFTLDSPSHLDTLNARASSGVSGAYYDMLRFADRQGSGIATWSFSGLTIGNTYQFQVWYQDNVSATASTGLVMGAQTYLNAGSAVTPVINGSGTVTLLNETTTSGPGQYAIGTFVADATTQTLIGRGYGNLTTTPTTASNITINAYQLRAVPEPSTVAFLFSIIGLLALRRRRS